MMLRLLLCCVLLALAGCSKPQPPEKERPVEPQASKRQDGLGNGKTDMPAMIQVPVDQARKIQDDMKKAEEQRQEAIDEAEGG